LLLKELPENYSLSEKDFEDLHDLVPGFEIPCLIGTVVSQTGYLLKNPFFRAATN